MAKPTKRNGTYAVGYGRPPTASRFSSTNQPQRRLPPIKLQRTSALEMSAEKVTVQDHEGKTKRIRFDDLIIEKMFERASTGSLRDLRDLLAFADAEEDAMLADPLARFSKKKWRAYRTMIHELVEDIAAEGACCIDKGLAYVAGDGRLYLRPWVKWALAAPVG